MKRKWMLQCLAVLTVSFLTGCNSQTLAEFDKQNTQLQSETKAEAQPDGTIEEGKVAAEEELVPVMLDVFYSNEEATGFDSKQVELQRVTPEALIEELAKVNVVSYDTKVLSFFQSGEHLSLDLSEDFSKYLNMMGSSGEYIVIGSLVNSFLTYYEADDILIMVDGKGLATSHAIYDKPLTMFEDSLGETKEDVDKKEAMAYRLKDTSFHQEEKTVYYPQFDGMPDEVLQNLWNKTIEDIALGNITDVDTEYEAYKVDYQVGYCSTEKISFKFTKTTMVQGVKHTEYYALSFDFVEGKCIRFADLPDVMETVSYNLANQGYYKVLAKDADRETFDEYYKQNPADAGDFREMFLYYDYNPEDLGTVPQGYIFINGDGELEIFMAPVNGLSEEQITIRTGIKLK